MANDFIYAEFASYSENEGLARVLVSAFMARLDPTLEELEDVRTAVSEAVTNAIVHGYRGLEGSVYLRCTLDERLLTIEVEDHGLGICDLDQAMQPLYTSRPEEERSGMGFTMMQAFMDRLSVESHPGQGTKVVMVKSFRDLANEPNDDAADCAGSAGGCQQP